MSNATEVSQKREEKKAGESSLLTPKGTEGHQELHGLPMLLKPKDIEERYGIRAHTVYGWACGRGAADRPRILKCDGGIFVLASDLEAYIARHLPKQFDDD